jgi:hypothetical protein
MAYAGEPGRVSVLSGGVQTTRSSRGLSRLLLIVSAEAPSRLAYLKHQYGSETVEVILDRRVNQRRRLHGEPARERRRAARRQRDIRDELQTFGWALVRH